jgi:dinuclear metal center YbgI/SA1388 family protein
MIRSNALFSRLAANVILLVQSELKYVRKQKEIDVTTINDVCGFMDSIAPTRLAEDWDNVGLLVGDRAGPAERVMTCLTVTPESAAEAIARNVDLIVSHHPIPFRPLKRLTTDTTATRILWDLIRAGVSIYSPHTGFDSASEGINQTLSQRLGLQGVQPLVPVEDDPQGLGAGRIGKLASSRSLADFVTTVKEAFSIAGIHVVGRMTDSVESIAVACGSGGSFLEKARRAHCDTFVTGEATFHSCLEAKANNISLVLLGHYASERFAVEELANRLADKFDTIEVWASDEESDPLAWV